MIHKYHKSISLTGIGLIITMLAGCSSSTGNNTDIFADITTPTLVPALAATATSTGTTTSTVTTPITIAIADVNPTDANENTNTITISGRSYRFNSRRGESVLSVINTNAATDDPNQMQILSTQSAGNRSTRFARITTFIEGRGLGLGAGETGRSIDHITQALTGTQVDAGDYTQPNEAVIYNGQYNITSVTQANNSNGLFTLNVDFAAQTATGTTTHNGTTTGEFTGGTTGTSQQIDDLRFEGEGTLDGIVVTNMETRLYGPNAEEIAGIGTTAAATETALQNRIFSFIGTQE